MNSKEFAQVFDEQMQLCNDVLFQKAGEYATDDNRMHNFNAGAAISGKTPVEVLGGYMLKHTISVYHMIGEGNPQAFSREKWTEKITDHINYLILLQALLQESLESESETP